MTDSFRYFDSMFQICSIRQLVLFSAGCDLVAGNTFDQGRHASQRKNNQTGREQGYTWQLNLYLERHDNCKY